MNIAVIGGAGYVGSVLCPMLAKKYSIKVLDTFWFWDSIQEYENLFCGKNHELVVCDIRQNIEEHLEGVDAVINLACISNDISSDLDKKFTHSVSYDGVMNVIRTCEKLGIDRFIQVSSGSVYGVKENAVREETYPEPITQYATIKMEIDHYLEHLIKEGDSITILRPATLYGRSPRQRLDLMLNIFADKVANNQKIVVHGGSQSRPALHVKDLSKTIEKILFDERSYGQVYNVSKEAMTVLEYAKMFEKMYGAEIVIENVTDARSWRTDSEKLYRDLGIIHETSLEQGIKELVNDFIKTPLNKYERIFTVNMDVVRNLLCH